MNANPTFYPPQNPYGYGAPAPRGSFPQSSPQSQPQQGAFYPDFLTSGPPTQLLEHQPAPYQQFQQHHGGFPNPQSGGFDIVGRPPPPNPTSTPYGQPPYIGRPPTIIPPNSVSSAATNSSQPTSMAAPLAPNILNNMTQQRQTMSNSGVAHQAQLQNAANTQRAMQQQAPSQPQPQPQSNTSLSPQILARDRLRVTVLLEINTHLLQEVVSLQAQGKAGGIPNQPQQSPISPASATDPTNPLNNSPIDATKQSQAKPPSQEYADCMRRLQANLAYLAAIADAKKKASGTLPTGPAIMIPPQHLKEVQELYKKLNALFPEASQSTINKAFANAQATMNPTNTSGSG